MFSPDTCEHLVGCDPICVVFRNQKRICVGHKPGCVVVCVKATSLPCRDILLEESDCSIVIEKLARVSRAF